MKVREISRKAKALSKAFFCPKIRKRRLILLFICLIVFCLFCLLGPLSPDIFPELSINLKLFRKVDGNLCHDNRNISRTDGMAAWNYTMLYNIWQQPATTNITIPDVFKPVMTLDDVTIYAQTLQDFVSNITAANLDYFMCGGTLIGSYRHHGIIPWDDDIDIMMSTKQKSNISALLRQLKPAYELIANGPRWKFYSMKANPVKGVKHKFPFLDICFYGENRWKIWDADPELSRKYIHPKSMVFPFVKRPFWNMWLNAPRDTYSFLMKNYDISKCVSSGYHHKIEQHAAKSKMETVECKSLQNAFPFVFREKIDACSTTEILYYGQRVIQYVTVPS